MMGAGRIYVPPFPGIFSAVGLLLAEYRHDAVRSLAMPLDEIAMDLLRVRRAELDGAVREAMARQLPDRRELEVSALVDLRYRGQDKPLTLALPQAADAPSLRALLEEAFRAAHQAAYGYLRGEAPEIVALRLRATATAGVGR